MLPGGAGEGIAALSRLGQEYPKARLALCGFGAAGENLAKRLADAGIDAAHIIIVSQSRTTAEDAHYSAALLKPKPDESWLLITAAMHTPRAVGCLRAAGFQVQPYPLEFMTRGRSSPFALFATGSALIQLDRAAKERIGLIADRVMGKTDALFPGPWVIRRSIDWWASRRTPLSYPFVTPSTVTRHLDARMRYLATRAAASAHLRRRMQPEDRVSDPV